MSYTEIFGFNKNGDAYSIGEIRNAFRGAMAVWTIIEKKYLPPWKPLWAMTIESDYSRVSDMSGESMEEIWSLFKSDKVTEIDRIVLGSTFDNVIVMKKDISKVLECFRAFEGESSLKEQADLIVDHLIDHDPEAIAWNGTSVNSDNWCNYGGQDEDDEPIPYNLNTGDRHWDLFESVEKNG